MPRQQSESAHYLNAYKLTIEKNRLQQELDSLAKRRELIQERLDGIEQQLVDLEHETHQYRSSSPSHRRSSSEPNSVIYPPTHQTPDPADFRTVMWDY
jgi:hypothetical protein